MQLSGQDIARLTEATQTIGTARFAAAFSALCAGLAGADSAYMTAFFDTARPAEIHATHTDPVKREALALYLEVAFVLDPFYHLYHRKSGDRVDRLRDIAPDDFRRSEYFAKFFGAMQLSDECGVMLQITGASALFLSLGARGSTGLKIAPLRAALPLLGALARRHWTVLTPERVDGSGRLAEHLDRAFDAFGTARLSPREGEITRMILRGHSSKAIAQAFDNSPETIKVHRKRIYAKLGVASQGALLSLFLEALRRTPAGAHGDPLDHLPPGLLPPTGD